MNFFKLYIGDYQRDTAHLSVTEHGAYLLMLQHYYATEKPLPAGKALHRMLRAQEKPERDAIDAVVEQFWRETADGLVNDRADVEITKAGMQADTNARIARERELRRKAQRKDHDQSTNRATNDQPNQTPDTRHHSQTPDKDTGITSLGERGEPENQRVSMAGAVCIAMKAAGIGGVNPGHPDLAALIEAGAEVQNFVAAARLAKDKGKGFAYALGAVKGQLQDAKNIAAAGMAAGVVPIGSSGGSARAARMAEAVPALTTHRQKAGEIIELEATDVTARRLG